MMQLLLSLLLLASPIQDEPELLSGRPITPEQAAYDVKHYTLDLKVTPDQQRIDGNVTVRAEILKPTQVIVLDLDQRLTVTGVSGPGPAGARLKWKHRDGQVRIESETFFPKPGREFELTVLYGGVPRVAPRAPWDGGFVWSRTESGAHWIATANQMQGADLWWPCKDQPDDEPDGMTIKVTVPRPLKVISNGRLAGFFAAGEGWHTYQWEVSTPINVYGVALNIAPYERITREVESVAGDIFPVIYWHLPENTEKAKVLFEDIVRQVKWFEETYGPYPFRGDKYGVVETPHLGMEHQSVIAYGNNYSGNPWGKDRGFDFLHHHEMAHEWWANLVTAKNWNDFWIHEGFGTYAQALYVEHLHGQEAYFEEMESKRFGIRNRAAVAPREPRSTTDMYFGDRAGSPGGDIYNKGSWILHTLRWYLGDDEVFMRCLRRMAYPDPALEATLDGSACRFATTDELQAICEKVSGKELGWLFDFYLRQPEIPELVEEVHEGKLILSWKVPGEKPFPMPIQVVLDGELRRLDAPEGRAEVSLENVMEYEVDPNRWVLRQ